MKDFDEYGLTRAGFAHDGKAFALIHVQRDAPDGVKHLPAQGEFHIPDP